MPATILPLARTRGYYRMPTNALADTFDRANIAAIGTSPGSGFEYLCAIELTAGMIISNFNFRTGTIAQASGGTHQWCGLYDSAMNQLATTSDQALTAMAAATTFTWPITTLSGGGGSTYTIPTTGLYYVGICLVGGTPASVESAAVLSSGSATINYLPYSTVFVTAGGETTPRAFPYQPSSFSGNVNYWYIWLS